MHPVILWGAAALIGYFMEKEREALRRQAEEALQHRQALERRRRRAVASTKEKARRAALAAIKKLIATVKEERRAAARARDGLPWRSAEREGVHELVVTLTRRLDALHAKKRKLYGS
jgi:hypothetical protein